ncbi:bifunctional tRNA (adenosine(37)-N6)-threonylcarbamoyltransferase complex ATPase subunit type 1 TsaE/phosphotransferase [Azorhizobium oxalatiphilum]|uniref:tRNA threonylcarbamoyladenosine biosynthesis protein TsaE n=1 Tax=Azorhizobium oxalatiphilum TaxID=980631 RepID=A0A917BKZ1_9HYPH|nr:tRNA (adenosine(37)-N6)-threonylcarbamoyltransferase complex ATPase subunit type 1 TsaE [Azorhizobium oxalatiphilum]GGF48240.1 bifunctional tRNA (adenosine(37)-N6)-threonylcarbamoyltransferase complex ATPase subunit type 1 TsaE/phosphotransferase [Azorhizobium oxalatiphilum]
MSLVFERVPGPVPAFSVVLDDLADTARLAAMLAPWLSTGDTVALSGDLGAGKTAFARCLIRALSGEPDLEVPSPTFSLVIGYEFGRGKVVHADLYRLQDPDELEEIGWDELATDAILLVEWPDRAEGRLPANRLGIALELAPDLGPDARRVVLVGAGAFVERLDRMHVAEFLIETSGFSGAERLYLQGDASSRSYARLVLGEKSAVLMNAPRRPDGPPVRRGLPYSRLAHLAEDVRPFIAMARALRAQGLSAPEIYAADLDRGLLILEDLGSAGVVTGTPPEPMPDRYAAAMELLASLHGRALPSVLHIAPQVDYVLPTYTLEAFLIEVELLLDWYLPFRGAQADNVVREEFLLIWRGALSAVLNEPQTWVLRDFHSPNLIWLDERPGLKKVGLIDFQDAVLGPAAYDVASLAQDARVDVSEELEAALLDHYLRLREEASPTFDATRFTHLYALMGAQRATKILGIFARLNARDGKPQYLRHLPRIRRYLARCLAHPELGSLRAWYAAVLPSKEFNS